MSDGIQYDVSAVLKVVQAGQFHAEMSRAAQGASHLQMALDRVTGGARTFAGGLSEVVGRTTALVGAVSATALAATTASTAMAAVHIGKNLQMLEDKSIQLSSVVSVAMAMPFQRAQEASSALFAKFQQDALKSAGETSDFVDAAAKIAPAMLGAGKSLDDVQAMTQGIIAAAKPMGVTFEQAGSDIMRALGGQAGSDLPLFSKLSGLMPELIGNAERFNKLDVGQRIDAMGKALRNPGFLAASDAAGDSFTGLVSTGQDLLKSMGRLAMAPTFGLLKSQMKGIAGGAIEGLKPGGPLDRSLGHLGNVVAHHLGAISRMFPNLMGPTVSFVDVVTGLADRGLAQVENGVAWIAGHWPQITSGAAQFATWIDHAADRSMDMVRALGGGDLGKGLERAGMALVGGRALAPVGSMALGAAQMGQGMFSLGRLALGAGGGAAGAAGAGAAGGAAGAGGLTGAVGAAGAAAAAPAAGLLAFLGLGKLAVSEDVFGMEKGVSVSSERLGDALGLLPPQLTLATTSILEATGLWSVGFGGLRHWLAVIDEKLNPVRAGLEKLGGNLGHLWDASVKLYNAAEPLIAVFATLYTSPIWGSFMLLLDTFERMIPSIDAIVSALNAATVGVTGLAIKLTDFLDDVNAKLGIKKGRLDGVDEQMLRRELDLGLSAGAPALGAVGGAGAGVGIRSPSKPADKGAQKVEVTLKWDLGEGNEEAIYVRSKRDITEMVRNAKGFVRSGPLPGRFG